jgi:cytochrome c peroxidase
MRRAGNVFFVALFFAIGSQPTLTHAQPHWSEAELAVLASLRLSQLPPSPADPSNKYEKNPQAIALGKRLFFDPRFSRNGEVSCATCHDPAKQFQDGRPRGQALAVTTRRTMPLAGAGYSPWQFWDGRKDSLWSQALAPLEDAREQGGNRLQFAKLIQQHYRPEYESLFGLLPYMAKLPMNAGPLGSSADIAAWNAIDAATQSTISRVFANMGKAIGAYVKTLRHGESRLDRYIEALWRRDTKAASMLNAQEQSGLRIFIGKGQCVTCHNGPLLTDHFFHSTRVPPLDPSAPDPGRSEGALQVQQDEFNCLGKFSDAAPAQCLELKHMSVYDPELRRAFKTPSLRGVAERAPYMHAGQFATLREVIQHYVKAPEAAPATAARAQGHGAGSALLPLPLTDVEIQQLEAFLATLSGPVVETGIASNAAR